MSIIPGETIKRVRYSFEIECNIPDWGVWVYFDGEPLWVKGKEEEVQVYKWLGDNMRLNTSHLYNFINKFVRDEAYRNKYLNGERGYRK